MIYIYSAARCPFAHRTRILLEEKGVPYTVREVDLQNRPEELYEVNPYGKVPVIVDGETVVYESAVINEYLDETYPEPPLMPETPAGRARARIWADFCNTRVAVAAGRIYRNRDPERGHTDLGAHLETLTGELDGREYLCGTFSLADIAFMPWLARLAWLEEAFAFQMPAGCELLRGWVDRLLARPSYQATRLDTALLAVHART